VVTRDGATVFHQRARLVLGGATRLSWSARLCQQSYFTLLYFTLLYFTLLYFTLLYLYHTHHNASITHPHSFTSIDIAQVSCAASDPILTSLLYDPLSRSTRPTALGQSLDFHRTRSVRRQCRYPMMRSPPRYRPPN